MNIERRVRIILEKLISKLEIKADPRIDAKVIALFCTFGRYDLKEFQKRYTAICDDDYLEQLYLCSEYTNLLDYYIKGLEGCK